MCQFQIQFSSIPKLTKTGANLVAMNEKYPDTQLVHQNDDSPTVQTLGKSGRIVHFPDTPRKNQASGYCRRSETDTNLISDTQCVSRDILTYC
jgi:hypothetical protein